MIATLLLIGWALAVMLFSSGCAGMEVGGKLGVYRVDSRSDRSATTERQTKPLLCYLKQCNGEELSRGS